MAFLWSAESTCIILLDEICEKAGFFPDEEEQTSLAIPSAFFFLAFSPAWNMDIMSRAEQTSCDYEDGGVGAGS